jgi:integrase
MAKNRNHHLVKRDNVWYFRIRKGKQVIRKTLSTSITEARRLRDDLLREIGLNGDLTKPRAVNDEGPLFGEMAEKWAKIKTTQIKASTMRDYRSSMNLYILPRFGNSPIRDISYLDVEEFKAELNRSAKRINNILVPMRSVFTMPYKEGIIKDNVMSRVDNLRIDEPIINPLSMEETLKVLECVHPHYKNCLVVLFFTGLRFGEMAGLKWRNVHLERSTARICETLVYGVEGRTKTRKSNRDIDLLPPVMDALMKEKERQYGKSDYVFLDVHGNPLTTDHLREVIWKPALKKAGIEYRPLMQTRHTFATLSLSEGENIGWVQHMLEHSSLQMIFTKYYAWIPKKTRNDGSAMMKAYEKIHIGQDRDQAADSGLKVVHLKKCAPNVPHQRKRTYTGSV